MDSQVGLAVLIEGRSSSLRLNNALRKVNALTVAAWLFPAYGFIVSEWNPSDKPSRRWERGGQNRHAYPCRRRTEKKTVKVRNSFV